MKKKLALLMGITCLFASVTTVSAANQYDYEMKYLYDQKFDCLWADFPTFGELVGFQSSMELNLDTFINSEWGEQTAKNFYTYITYAKDPMNENLVAYWARKGLSKEVYLGEENENQTISDDYYVYSPIGSKDNFDTLYPCIIVNHGGGEPAYQAETFGYCQIAAEEGIILIMAENEESANLYEILEQVKEHYPVDTTRIYATGSSMGAMQSINLSVAYPTLLAAITTLDVAPKYLNSEASENFAKVQEVGLPIINIAGLADKYDAYPMDTNQMNSISGWNDLMTVTGHDDYLLTSEESAELSKNSLNIIEHYTGGKFEDTEILYPENNEVFINNFYDEDQINNLRIVVVENKGHIPSGYDAKYSWEFMKHFSRDAETGLSVYTE